MNLKEWTSMEKTAREQYEAECYRRGTPREIGKIAEEATRALALELNHLPQVSAVMAGEDNVEKRSILMVTTSLRTGEKLSTVPEEFAGFPVVQYGVGDRKEDYLKRLEFVLRAASLPEAEANAILKRFDMELSNIGSTLYIHTPEWWFAEILVPVKTKGQLLGEPMLRLRDDVRATLTNYFKEANFDSIRLDQTALSRLRTVLQNVFRNHDVNL